MNPTQQAALKVLFKLAREDKPADLSLIAAHLGLSCVETDRLLNDLARLGLVDPDRVRLTMSGLVLAVSSSASSRSKKKTKEQRAA